MPVAEARPAGRPVGAILKDIAARSERVARAEARLAAAHVREEATDLGRHFVMIAGGLGLALLATGFVLVGAARLLATAMPAWLADMAVGAVALAGAGLVASRRPAGPDHQPGEG